MDPISRTVAPTEIRRDTEAMLSANPADNLTWLEAERNLEAALRTEAFAVDDKVEANRRSKRVDQFVSCIDELRRLREITGHMTIALRNKILVSLTHAEKPAWAATHRHYKGGLYRVTGTRKSADGDELIDGIEYDDAAGNRYFLRQDRFESLLDSGRPRYQLLYGEKE